MRILHIGIAAIALFSPAFADASTPARDGLLQSEVVAGSPGIERLARGIWTLAETGFHETRSSQLLQKELKEAGFEVISGSAGMPTAFVARFRSGDGPVIGITAEFDALPGVAQDAAAVVRTSIEGKAAGHACGHNLLGAGSVGAAIAIRRWLLTHRQSGEIRVYGSPAEENGDGKAYMVRAGLLADVDVVLHWHPKDVTAVWTEPTQANIKTRYMFEGLASHAAGSPERGRSALAGVEVMDTAINAMRQFTPDGTRIHGVIINGGDAPNVVPAHAASLYFVRNYDLATLQGLQARMIKAAQGSAMATETEVTWQVEGGVYPLLINDTLARVAQESLDSVLPGLAWTPAEQRYAEGIQQSLGVTTGSDLQPLALKLDAAPTAGSTDIGDISYTVPTVGVFVTAWPHGTPAHSWAAAGASGSSIGMKAAVVAAEVLAQTAVRLLQQPELVQQAKAELVQKRGRDFRYRALFGDRAPPIDIAPAR